MSRKTVSDEETKGLLRATDHVLEHFCRYLTTDIKYDDIDYEEYFEEGKPITLDQLRHFFQDRAEWFFNGDEFPNETAIETWGKTQEEVPLYQAFIEEEIA
jgi:hypothetical protein